MEIILNKMIADSIRSKEPDFDFETENLTNDDMLANVSPGSSKSTILSQMSLAWVWTKMPECVGIFSTISNKNAKDFASKFKIIIQSDKYKRYFPNVILSKDSGEALFELKNTLGGARFQYTTLSAKTGMHGHYIAVDDNMAFEDARSDARAEACNESLKGLFSREKKNARVPKFFFMQMQSKIDSTQWILKRFPDIKRFVLPAWDNGKIYPPELKEFYVDGYFNPYHMGEEFLRLKKLQYSADEGKFGDLQYLAEYGQDCETSEGYMYSVCKVDTIEKKGISIATCDPAEDGECFLASVFAYVYSNKVWVHDIIYTKEGSEITIPKNVEKAKLHKPYAFYIEKDGLGNTYQKQVKAKYSLVQSFNAKGNKDDRIYTKGAVISNHFVFLKQAPHIEYENAVNHLTTYKKVGQNKYKDFEDALTSLAEIVIKNNLINVYG
jgi:predicted phage terminase large subunit-like protein